MHGLQHVTCIDYRARSSKVRSQQWLVWSAEDYWHGKVFDTISSDNEIRIKLPAICGSYGQRSLVVRDDLTVRCNLNA